MKITGSDFFAAAVLPAHEYADICRGKPLETQAQLPHCRRDHDRIRPGPLMRRMSRGCVSQPLDVVRDIIGFLHAIDSTGLQKPNRLVDLARLGREYDRRRSKKWQSLAITLLAIAIRQHHIAQDY